MTLFNRLKVKTKLPLVIAGLCIATGLAMMAVIQVKVRSDTSTQVREEFAAVASARETAVKRLMDEARIDLVMLSESPDVANALGAIGSSFRLLPNPAEVLGKAYVTTASPAEREALDRTEGEEAYHLQHNNFHPILRRTKQLRGLHDILLFDPDLNAIYTVAKEADFATSFRDGPYAGSSLAAALRQAETAAPGEVIFADFAPYAASEGAYAAFMVTRMANRIGKTTGYLAAQINTDDIHATLDDHTGLGESGDAFLVGTIPGQPGTGFAFGEGFGAQRADGPSDGVVLIAADRITPQIAAALEGKDSFHQDVPTASGETGFAMVDVIDLGDTRWALVIERASSDVFSRMNALLLTLALIGLAISTAGAGIGIWFSRSLTRPLDGLAAAIDHISRDDLSVAIPGTDREDELGTIAVSLGGLRDKLAVARLADEERARLQEELRLVVEALSTGLQDLAEGNLTRPIETPFAVDYDSLRVDFNTTLETLSQTIANVVEASVNIRERSNEISSASEDLSRRTENQAAALEETAAALDELTASVKSAADGAREVETIVRSARQEAEDSGTVVQGAVAAMAEIARSSEQISQIIGAIDDIAFQTNLLALNAGVEAARAGDAGRGFAVVASEVRALAQRSSAAAREIKTLIAASSQHVGRGVDQVGQAGDALKNIVGSVAHISTLVTNIASGAAEQSTGLSEINIGVTQLDQVTQQNAAMVEEATAASQALRQDAKGLADMIVRFRLPDRPAAEAPIDLIPFVPTEFAGPAPLPEAAPAVEEAPRRAARGTARPNPGGTAAMWQEF